MPAENPAGVSGTSDTARPPKPPVLSVEEARELVLARVSRLDPELVPPLEAVGRVLAEDLTSDIDVAPFDNSAMDGYAIRAEDAAGASPESPISLEVVRHIAAGDFWEGTLLRGQAVRIMTGAPVPAGADAVVMVEYTSPAIVDAGAPVSVLREATLGEHIRRRGEEVRAGDVVLSAGEVMTPAAVGLAASTGHPLIPVFGRPRVAVISTGSELVEIDQTPGPGKIRNSNSYSLAAQVIAAGGIPVRFGIVPDDEAATREAFEEAAQGADFIITSGGVSVGDFDYVKPVLESLGELAFCKVAMRPGNPQTLGSIHGVPFFGLPGNPTSTYVGFEIFVRPALRMMQGYSQIERPHMTAVLAHDVKKKQDRRYYLRARIERDSSGTLAVALSGSQSSALLTAAHRGNCFMVLPEGEGHFAKGTLVDCLRLDIEEGTPL